MMNEMLAAAISYAERGWRVFPLHGIVNGLCTCGRRSCGSVAKHPLVRRGLYEATTDPKQIQSWWRRWRSANVGIATGATSGIAVIDIDLPRALPSLKQLVHKFPSTLTGCTGGGGLHLIYRGTCADLRCTTSQVPGIGHLIGVDVRAEGGYIVAPPSIHRSGRRYEWLDPNAPLKPAPEWLKHPPRSSADLGHVTPTEFEGDGTPYGLAVLRAEVDRVGAAKVGTRNHELNRASFVLAQLVAGGELLETAVRASLLPTALSIGLGEPEARQTIDSAFQAGLRSPRVAPDRLSGR